MISDICFKKVPAAYLAQYPHLESLVRDSCIACGAHLVIGGGEEQHLTALAQVFVNPTQ